MKKLFYTILISFLSINAIAQDSVLNSDSTLNSQLSILNFQLDSIDTITTIDTMDSAFISQLSTFNFQLDSIVHDYYLEKAFTIDCERIDSDAVYFSDSVYMARLQSMPQFLPLIPNAYLLSFVPT